MNDLISKLRQTGSPLIDRLRRGFPVSTTRYMFAPPQTNYGIPESELTAQIQELQKKGRGLEDAQKAIDMHPQIVDKGSAKQFAGKLYEGFVQPFRNVLEAKSLARPKTAQEEINTENADKIVEEMKGTANKIMTALNLPADITEAQMAKSDNPTIQKLAPYAGFLVAAITPMPGDDASALAKLAKKGIGKLSGKEALQGAEKELVKPLHTAQEIGEFGTVYRGLDVDAAIKKLIAEKGGEAVGVVSHPELGSIDLIYGKVGKDGYGIAKIESEHKDILPHLGELLQKGKVVGGIEGRKYLETEGGKAIVRLDWDGNKKSWVLTAYVKNPVLEGKGLASPL